MEGKLFLCKYLIWMMILLGQLHGYKSCIHKERKALLDLQKFVSSITKEEESDYVLPTWTNDTTSDCCLWEDVTCNRTTGRVTEIAFGTLYLKENSLLNLSLLHPFEELRSLNLSKSRFSFLYPKEERGFHEDENNLFAGFFDDVEGYKSLSRLRNLEILDLSSNKFNNRILPFLSAATSLTTLFLRDNYMDGPFPAKELKDLTNLELLDLSRNKFNGTIPSQELSILKNLKALDLSDNEFSGSLKLQGICKLKNMQELDLSRNKLVGRFPLCLTTLIGLRVLDLSSNQLTENLPSSLGNLESIEYLSLFENNFQGFFSVGLLENLSKLRVLKLGSKSNSLQVEFESSWKPKFQLSVIILRSCNLETVPHFLLHQKSLRQVDLSGNKISGSFPSWLLTNNMKLEVLLLQNNCLTSFQLPKSTHGLVILDVSVNEFNHMFPENIGWILPHLISLNISNNGFQGNMPSSLGNMEEIEYMDISYNNFHGRLPRSVAKGWNSITILKLSHNKLSGEVFPESTNFYGILMLSMDNNQFTGNIGQGLRSLTSLGMLDISNNNLSGVIPNWIGELTSLTTLLLSNNSLEGEIPISLFKIPTLQLLDLSANILSGDIPPHVNFENPLALYLQDNKLSGAIPETLLMNVIVLDLRNNNLFGKIPEFINSQNISILLLRGNNLTGGIPRQLCTLRSIHMLDLSNNKLNGSIPSCLSNTSFGFGKENMFSFSFLFDFGGTSGSFEVADALEQDTTSTENVSRYFKPLLQLDPFYVSFMDYKANTQAKIEFATKHRYDTYMVENLELLFGVDLSGNELSGEIPVELGGLFELQALNLSHNKLSGVIPESFLGMKNVESLDLTYNRLQGRIPPQLTELTSLAVFNVSYNNFSGVIPQGRQFNTFDTQSYLGNPFLCGQPTNISCNNNNFQESISGLGDDESTIDMVSFYWSFVAGYVIILLGLLASLSFDSPWSRAWFYIVDAFTHKLMNLLR